MVTAGWVLAGKADGSVVTLAATPPTPTATSLIPVGTRPQSTLPRRRPLRPTPPSHPPRPPPFHATTNGPRRAHCRAPPCALGTQGHARRASRPAARAQPPTPPSAPAACLGRRPPPRHSGQGRAASGADTVRRRAPGSGTPPESVCGRSGRGGRLGRAGSSIQRGWLKKQGGRPSR